MTTPKEYALGTFHGLWQAAQDHFGGRNWSSPSSGPMLMPVPGVHVGSARCSEISGGPVGSLYCSTCGDQRRMFLTELCVAHRAFYPSFGNGGVFIAAELVKGGFLHGLFGLRCVQCSAASTAVMYEGPNGDSLCLLPSTYGGPATLNSPGGVKFYCDQASRAGSVGAYTAALAMLRPAVDVVLETHGYTKKWLGDKLADLEKHINDGTGALWTKQYNHEFLVALKNLANDALHTRASGVPTLAERQDEELYRSSEISIAHLLDIVYERPEREKQRLAKLKNAILPKGEK